MVEIDTSDEALIAAIRRRILSEIDRGRDAREIVQNIYASGAVPGGGGGVRDIMSGGEMPQVPPGEDPYEYFVDILRETVPEGGETMSVDPETGEPRPVAMPAGGWKKSVHRFRRKKKAD